MLNSTSSSSSSWATNLYFEREGDYFPHQLWGVYSTIQCKVLRSILTVLPSLLVVDGRSRRSSFCLSWFFTSSSRFLPTNNVLYRLLWWSLQSPVPTFRLPRIDLFYYVVVAIQLVPTFFGMAMEQKTGLQKIPNHSQWYILFILFNRCI